jgi:hypothetical protein
MANTAFILRCDTEIQTDTLGVPDVQIPVRLRWKTRYDPAIPFIGLYVFCNNLTNKIEFGIFFFARCFHDFLISNLGQVSTL